MVATKLQKYEAKKIYQKNHEVAKNDQIGAYVWDMKQASADANVVTFLQTNYPLSAEWKLGVNLQIDEQLKVVDDALGSGKLITCSSTAFIAKCDTTANSTTGAPATNKLADFVVGAYDIKVGDTALTAQKVTTENLIPDTAKKYTVALKAEAGVKGAVKDQATAKALTAIKAFGDVIVDNTGAIQTAEVANIDVKLSAIANLGAGSSSGQFSVTNCAGTFTSGSLSCLKIIQTGVGNYLNSGKGGTGAGDGAVAGIAGAKQIHDYLEGINIVDAAQAGANKTISVVADSTIPKAFDTIGAIKLDGASKVCGIAETKVIQGEGSGMAEAEACKTAVADIKDAYDSDAEKNAKKAQAMQFAHDMASDEYFTGKIGTQISTTIIDDTAGIPPVIGYNNFVGNHAILAKPPVLLKKIVLNYEANVVGASGWANGVALDTVPKQTFAKEYNLLAQNICGLQIGEETDVSYPHQEESKDCMKAYYAYVNAVTTACTTKAIDETCATAFAGKLIAAYDGQFDVEGIPHLNADEEAQGNFHYDL